MSGLPWYAHDIKAYEAKTAHLSILEHGAYRLMMDHYYKTAAPLPANVEQVHRICRALAEHEQVAVTSILHQFFALDADGWHNEKADEELSRMADISGKRSIAAKNRHSKPSANAPAIADTLNTDTDSTSSLRSDVVPPRNKPRRSLPELFPLEPDQDWAKAHWLAKGRADLCNAMTEEIEKFRDHHTGRATMSADWPGSWRTWTRNAMNFSRRGNANGTGSGKPRPAADQHLAGIAELSAELRQRRA